MSQVSSVTMGGGASRYRMLAVGTLAQMSFGAFAPGVAVMLPALKSHYGLTIGQTGVVVALTTAGQMASLLLWGFLVDSVGERPVVCVGLAAASAALLLTGWTRTVPELMLGLFAISFLAASVSAASGRLIMNAFGSEQRGFAIGVRQAAVPAAGAIAGFALPLVVGLGGTKWGFWALGVWCAVGAFIGLGIADGSGSARRHEEVEQISAGPLRDKRIWWLTASGVLMIVPQMALFGFTVLFLHESRKVSDARAAAIFATIQLLAVGARVLLGRWSDRRAQRVRPLRFCSIASAISVAAIAASAHATLFLLVPVIVIGGVIAVSWNGLTFVAVAEAAGRQRTGAALGLLQTGLTFASTVVPPVFAALVGGIGWSPAFALASLFPLGSLPFLLRVERSSRGAGAIAPASRR